MLKELLKCLISESRKFAKAGRIFDIILYGSFIRGKQAPRDIDIIIVFLDSKLEERLKLAQYFKKELKSKIKKDYELDIKTANLIDLFESSFLAREGILVEGYSLLYSCPFAERIGFKGYTLFTYKLKGLTHNEKTKFTYSLIGRNKKGISELTRAKSLGRGAVIVPIENSSIFEDFLKEWKTEYVQYKVLFPLT